MVHMLAAGVFFSGFIKDLVCLPRPLSPPLQRISRSASVALEYGFPSTHSTNAVSVAIYAIHSIRTSNNQLLETYATPLQVLFTFYATSIIVGRLYCGMHGFFDVVFGSLLGVLIAVVQITLGPLFDDYISTGPFKNTVVASLIVLALVRRHPEPADNCPCFDDSVAFAGTFIGVQVACYQFSRSPYSISDPIPSTVPFDFQSLGIVKTFFRILIGVLAIFGWRAVAKPTILRVLPPIFRIISTLGLLLPRKFFLSATQYNLVPTLRKDDNVIPPASEIPGMLQGLRHPRRRAISIGPQSEADAYEHMQFRERRRRESQGQSGISPPLSPVVTQEANGSPREQPVSSPAEDVNGEEDDDEALFRELLR